MAIQHMNTSYSCKFSTNNIIFIVYFNIYFESYIKLDILNLDIGFDVFVIYPSENTSLKMATKGD
jgi:hypothetical protein